MRELILKNTKLLMKKCISFLAIISLFSNISIALDTITPNQFISDNQTLVSPNQIFELGFFSPSNSKNRYLGIWYKFSPLTVVWVANRNDPLTDSSGVLTITYNGDIVLLNRSKSIIWSSNTSRSVESPVAQLLDSGNLVLKDDIYGKSASYLWQSFDYLCDTLIPGMKQGWNLTMGVDQYLTSWKNVDDPSIGEYSYRMEHSELPQLVLHKGSIKQFRTGPWNGIRLSGISHFVSNPVFKAIFMSNSDEAFYMTEISDASVITRLVMNQSGIIQRFTWNHESLDWRLLFTVLKDQCDNYGFCGSNSICNISNSSWCQCLHGFRPKLQQNWEAFIWLEGCVRRIPLDCGKGDKFLKIEQVKLPDTLRFWVNKSMSLSECEVECLKNCNCTAYANSDIRGGGSGCIIWFGDLVDIRQFIDVADQDLYIRLAASELEPINYANKKKRPTVIIVIISIASSMLLLGSVIGCIIWKIRRKKEVNNKSGKEEQELPSFDWTTIVTVTDNFSYANKIGEGGFGSVYKGNLAGGQEIAVKRLSKDSGQGLTEFTNELILIAKLQHRNLVKLLGYCIQGEEKMLIYEYMPNKSLDYFIFDKTRSKLVDWKTRFEIVLGIARGLLYLHQDSRLRIIHRDLKASNILLDSNLNPKISDFGMAKLFGGDQTEEKTKRVVGTYGYMSPEYAIEGYFSVKSDVFSFGVLVLEIVSGKRNRGFYHPNHHHNLLGHAWILWEEGNALKLMDTCLEDSCLVSEVLRCIQVGLLCVQKLRDDRPNMSSVVFMLGTEISALPQPKQPGFFGETSPIDTSTEERRTENVLSITSLEAR